MRWVGTVFSARRRGSRCGEFVDADQDLLAGVDGALVGVGGVLDLLLDVAALDGAEHAVEPVAIECGDGVEVGLGAGFELVGEGFDEVGAGERVGGVGDAALVGEDLLGAEGDAGGLLGGQGEGLVEAVGVQALRAAEDGGQRLDGGADDVVLAAAAR